MISDSLAYIFTCCSSGDKILSDGDAYLVNILFEMPSVPEFLYENALPGIYLLILILHDTLVKLISSLRHHDFNDSRANNERCIRGVVYHSARRSHIKSDDGMGLMEVRDLLISHT